MGAVAGLVAMEILSRVHSHTKTNRLGLVFNSDCGYQMFAMEPRRVRYPDGSFIRRGRLPNNAAPQGHVHIAPDWALEVVSPNDAARDVECKIDDYLLAGVQLIWLVYPDTRTVYVYRANKTVSRLTAGDDLTGEDIFPGFTCRVADLFEEIEPEGTNHVPA
jgi:Uma2 family endonuclease